MQRQRFKMLSLSNKQEISSKRIEEVKKYKTS
jgi:hypothetical protein